MSRTIVMTREALRELSACRAVRAQLTRRFGEAAPLTLPVLEGLLEHELGWLFFTSATPHAFEGFSEEMRRYHKRAGFSARLTPMSEREAEDLYHHKHKLRARILANPANWRGEILHTVERCYNRLLTRDSIFRAPRRRALRGAIPA